MAKVETKRFPMTIPVELDRKAEILVQGDSRYKGNRNRFFVDAIARAVSSYVTDLNVKLNGETVKSPETVQVDLQPPEQSHQTSPDEILKNELEGLETRGRTPMLDWRDGAIRNRQGKIYKLYYGPPRKEGQSKKEHFEFCKNLPGVIFVPVSDGLRIQVDNLGGFEIVSV